MSNPSLPTKWQKAVSPPLRCTTPSIKDLHQFEQKPLTSSLGLVCSTDIAGNGNYKSALHTHYTASVASNNTVINPGSKDSSHVSSIHSLQSNSSAEGDDDLTTDSTISLTIQSNKLHHVTEPANKWQPHQKRVSLASMSTIAPGIDTAVSSYGEGLTNEQSLTTFLSESSFDSIGETNNLYTRLISHPCQDSTESRLIERPKSNISQKFRPTPCRTLELVILNLDCAVSEAALIKCLKKIPGVRNISIDVIGSAVYLRYALTVTSALVIVRSLRHACFVPVRCSLHSSSFGQSTSSVQLSQLTVGVPIEYQSLNGRTIIQNHTLALDGLKSCVVSADATEMYVTYDSRIIGGRSILKYINRAGVHFSLPCNSENTQSWDDKKLKLEIYGGCKFFIIFGIILFWLDTTPPPYFLLCTLNGVSSLSLLQFCLSIAIAIVIGSPTLLAGYSQFIVTTKFSAAFIVALSVSGIFFFSIMETASTWLLRATSPQLKNNFSITPISCSQDYYALGFTLQSWVLLLWGVGLSTTRYLRSRIERSIYQQEAFLFTNSKIRVVKNDLKQIKYYPHDLVQTSDIVLIRPGELLCFDGYAMTSALVKEPPLVTTHEDLRPYYKKMGDKALAGTRVMSGDFYVKITQVGEPKLERTLLSVKRSIIKGASLHRWIHHWATTYSIINFIIGIICGILVYRQRKEALAQPLLIAFSITASIWITGLTCSLNSATMGLHTAGISYLTTLGVAVYNSDLFRKLSKSKHIVISRAALLSTYEEPEFYIALCSTACGEALHKYRWNPSLHQNKMNCTEKIQLTVYDIQGDDMSELKIQTETTPLLFFSEIVTQLEMEYNISVNPSRLSTLLLTKLFSKQYILTSAGAKHCNIRGLRMFPGKGVEGTLSFNCDNDSNLMQQQSIAAIGNLDYIIECHQFNLNVSSSSIQKEWSTLKLWCEQQLIEGHETLIIACNGIPLGAIIIPTRFNRHIKPILNYIQTTLGRTLWLCTGTHVLSSRSISAQTGVSLDHIISGITPLDKIKFLERLSCKDKHLKKCVTFLTSSRTQIELTNKYLSIPYQLCSIFMGTSSPECILNGVDGCLRSSSMIGILNLMFVSSIVQQFQIYMLGLVFIFLLFFQVIFIIYSNKIYWKIAPLIAMIMILGLDICILVFSLIPYMVEPARIKKPVSSFTETYTGVSSELILQIEKQEEKEPSDFKSCRTHSKNQTISVIDYNKGLGGPGYLYFPNRSVKGILCVTLMAVVQYIQRLYKTCKCIVVRDKTLSDEELIFNLTDQ